MRIDLLLTSLALLSCFCGCVSTRPAPDIAYYLLSDNRPASDEQTDLQIASIELADYLQTSSIVLELEDSTLTQTRYHRWSEPLRSGIRRGLEKKLGLFDGDGDASYRADIVIERYHGTIDGSVFLEGRFLLHSSISGKTRQSGNFAFRSKVEEEGYPAMIRELASLLEPLAEQLLDARDPIR